MVILLSFDIEEFDMPMEYGKSISLEEQIAISNEGTNAVLDLLASEQIAATFFCTAEFALYRPQTIKRIANGIHEVASHGYYHSQFEFEHLASSKKVLEDISEKPINGYRMARLKPLDLQAVTDAGYTYNSSLNPTYLPGRYNNFRKPRTMFEENGCLQLPVSVSPTLRIPLFWLAFHNFPVWYYRHLSKRTMMNDGYLNLYFHPWEFVDLNEKEQFGFPSYIRRCTGELMKTRFKEYLRWCKAQGYQFMTISHYLATYHSQTPR